MGTISPHHHHHHQYSSSTTHFLTTKFISRAVYVLIPLALLHFYLSPLPLNLIPNNPSSPLNTTTTTLNNIINTHPSPTVPPRPPQRPKKHCNYAEGRWAPRAGPPPYNGTTCGGGGIIKDGQNCMAHGRPDTGYLHWRWQPDGCDLPQQFDPLAFLSLIDNKHLAFVGDSMARNQLESLLCLLSSHSSPPTLVYVDGDERKFRRWVFPSHNATVSVLWSPFLVNGTEKSVVPGLDHNRLFLDSADQRWASELPNFDIVVFSAGHWFLHPAVYYENNAVFGCHHCPSGFNRTDAEIGFFGAFRKAIRTALQEVNKRSNNNNDTRRLVVVTTFSPSHFEGEWDKAGACPKKEPYKDGEKEMEYMDAEMRRIELEEVAAAASATAERKSLLKLEALDVTRMALMRPDGHPGPYMYPNPFADGPKERVQNDCVHWCLPGPIDAWNEILLEIVRRWTDERKLR